MINHNELFKGKGSKNKNIAREFGAAFAQSWFEDMVTPEAQGVLFDWNNIPNMAKVGLGIYYRKTPANILELKEISHESFKSKYTELKEKYISENGHLPTRNDSVEIIADSIFQVSTKNYIHQSQVNFYAVKKKENIDDLDNVWKSLYLKEITVQFLKEGGLEKAKTLSERKNLSKESTDNIIEKVSTYYDNIQDLSTLLYSSH